MNHVIAVFKEQGVVAGLKKLADVIESEFTSLESQFPVIGEFVSQFGSDFGKQVLADAEALAPAVVAGTTKITDAAAQLVTQAAGQIGSIAAKDAQTVALNALRVHVTALQAAPAVEAPAVIEQPQTTAPGVTA